MGSAPSVSLVCCGVVVAGFSCTMDPPTTPGPPAIALSLDSAAVTVEQGASLSIHGTVTGSGGFQGVVTISLEDAPRGVTGSAPDIQGSGSAMITIHVDPTVVPGRYPLRVRAEADGVTDATETIDVTITVAPGYTLAVAPAGLTIERGASGVARIQLARTNFTEGVALTLEGAPSGMTDSIAAIPVTGDTASVTLTVGGVVAIGVYPLVVRGAASGLADRIDTLTVTVTAPNGPSYTMTLVPDSISIAPNGADSIHIGLTRFSFTGPVDLALENAPPGIAGAFAPAVATGDSAELRLAVTASVAPGTYSLTVRGTASGLSDRTTTLTVTVTAPNAPDYVMATTPDTLTIGANASDSAQIQLTRTNFAGTVNLALENAPAGVTGTFTPAAVTGDTSSLRLTVGGSVPSGTHTLTVRGTATGLSDRTATVTVIVPAAPAYAVSVGPDTVTADQGDSTTASITLTRTNFSGTVSFALENAPAGVTGTFNPSPTGGDQTTLTIAVGGSVAAASYNLFVRATTAALADRLDTLMLTVTVPAPALNCQSTHIRCVDDDSGAQQEYATLSAAEADVNPGDTVLVHAGHYAGVQIDRSGTAANPITFLAAPGAVVLINQSGPTGDGIRFQNTDYVTIDGFRIQDIADRCIAARGASASSPMVGNVVRNVTCLRSGHEGFYLSQFAYGLVENNSITETGKITSSGAHGIYLANGGSDHTTVRGNTISQVTGSGAEGIHMNGDLSIGGDGVITDLLIEDNRIFDVHTNGFNMDGVQNSVFRNNVLYNIGRHAMRGFQIDGSDGPQDLHIVNNTFVTGSGGSWAIKLTSDDGGHVIFNNILLGNLGSVVLGNPNVSADHNVVTNAFSLDGESSVINLAAWRAAGNGAQSVQSSAGAVFVDANADDYRLSASSPAIDAGVAALAGVQASNRDILGVSRPRGLSVDIGAYERP